MMEQGTGNVIPLSEAQAAREALGLTAAAAAREAEKRGVNVAGQVIRSWERGREVMDSGRLFAYLHVLWELQEEARNGTAARADEAHDETVAKLMIDIRALEMGIDHFVSTRLGTVTARDLQLLAGVLNTAHVRFRNMSSLLQGAVTARHGKGNRN